MDEGDRNGSLPNCRRNALDITAADIADGEHSGQTCFEQIRTPREGPMLRRQVVLRQIRPGLDEPVRIECDTPIEPTGVGYRAGHDEDMADVVSVKLARFVVPPLHALEVVAS